MPEVKRRLEQRIVDFLDTKAKNSKVTELTTIKPYATVEELARNLNSTRTQVSSLVEDLLKQNRIKRFPSSKARKEFYGSIILPIVTIDEATRDAKGSSYRIYGSEITLNLVIPLK